MILGDYFETWANSFYNKSFYIKNKMFDKALKHFVQALQLVPEGSPIKEEIEKEINKIYKSKLEN